MTNTTPQTVIGLATCPDCDSDVGTPYRDAFGLWHIQVRHDTTCPSYQNMKNTNPLRLRLVVNK